MNKKLKNTMQYAKPPKFVSHIFADEKKTLRLLIFISLAMALILPFFNIFVVAPELKRLLLGGDESSFKNIAVMQKQIDKLITSSSLCLSAANLVFLTAVAIISYKAWNAINKREAAEREIEDGSKMLEQRIIERTADLYREVYERKKIEEGLLESKNKYKKLSQEFNTLLDAIPEALILVSPDLKITWANKSASSGLGKESQELIGKTCHKLWFDCDIPCEDCYALRSFESGQQEGTNIVKPDGKIKETKAFPIKDETGAVKNVIIVSKDITEKIRIENELMRADKLDSLGVLAGGIAHDFNNMLAAITLKIAHAKLLAGSDEKVITKLAETEEVVSTAKSLPQQLLAFSKGGMSVRKSIFIHDLLKTSVNMALSGSGCKCEFSLQGDLWNINADEGQMIQVFNNIFINADHAMPNGGIIRVSAENIRIEKDSDPLLTGGEYIKISVKDKGAGIPAKDIQKVFEPFFTTKPKGNGLGLTIVHSIIKTHNGHISVESMPEKGTAFHVYLPAAEKTDNIEITGNDYIYGDNYKLLVMDDEDNIRDELCCLLKRRGYMVEEAKDGAEMLEAYKNAMHSSKPFDAVIMDMVIRGGMGGMAAIKVLMELDPNAKAIVASGYFNEPVLDDFEKYGFRGVIAKPYKIDELQRLLNNAMMEKR